MARGRSDEEPPRAGVNDRDAFVGEPPSKPPGLDPFAARYQDGSSEREAALELLPTMARVTSTHQPLAAEPSSRAVIIITTLVGLTLAGVAYYVFF